MTSRSSTPRVSLNPARLVTLPSDDPNAHLLVVSPDGTRALYTPDGLGFLTWKAVRTWHVVQDARIVLTVECAGRPHFSPDGTRLTYAQVDLDGAVSRVVDGHAHEKYDDMEDAEFSGDGQHVAYVARRGRQWYLVHDQRAVAIPGRECDGLSLSADGSRSALRCVSKEGMQAVIDGCAGPLFTGEISPPLISPDGRRVAYQGWTRRRDRDTDTPGRYCIIVDDRTFGPYDKCAPPCFTSDGGSWASVALRGKESLVVINGRELPCDEPVHAFRILPDDSIVVYVSSRIRRSAFVNPACKPVVFAGPQRGDQVDVGPYDHVSPDGRSVARRGWELDLQRVIRDGQPGPLFEAVDDLAWSLDSATLAYVAWPAEDFCGWEYGQPEGMCVVMANEARSAKFESVESALEVVDRRTVAVAARRGREIWWEVFRAE